MKNYFIPNRKNDYKPHFFRKASVLGLAFVIVFFFLVSLLGGFVLTKTDFLAAIVPEVLVDLTNQNREDNKLPPLAISPVLQGVAAAKANDMAAKGYFAHTSPEGITPWHWFRKAGYAFSFAGENLAVNFSDSFDVTRAWMISPGHRANILNLSFTEIGIAMAKGMYRGKETIFVVQVFGRPAALVITTQPMQDSSRIVASLSQPSSARPQSEETESVAGAVSAAPLEDNLETVIVDDMFIAVENLEYTALQETGVSTPAPHASLLDKFLSSPRTMLMYAYAFLGGLILVALLLMVFVEIRHQHPLHIFYGLFLLALIGTLVWSQKAILLSQVSVL